MIHIYPILCSCVDQHCCSEDGSTRPMILVTASVDKMVLRKPIKVDCDLTIEGAVTWVGRSSMEIQLEVTQLSQGIFWFLLINSINPHTYKILNPHEQSIMCFGYKDPSPWVLLLLY